MRVTFLEKLGILRSGRERDGGALTFAGESLRAPDPVQTIIELPDKDVRNIMHVRRVLEAESARLAAQMRPKRNSKT